jgi:hypothetical protein
LRVVEKGRPPHDELEQIAVAGHMEWGIWLYRCRICGSWWEFSAWTYSPDRCKLRRIATVASPEKWHARIRHALQPRSFLVSGFVVFLLGLACIAAWGGILWVFMHRIPKPVSYAVGAAFVLAGLVLAVRGMWYLSRGSRQARDQGESSAHDRSRRGGTWN